MLECNRKKRDPNLNLTRRGPTLLLAPTLAAMAAAARLAPLPRPFFEARGEPSDDQDEGGGGGGGSGGGWGVDGEAGGKSGGEGAGAALERVGMLGRLVLRPRERAGVSGEEEARLVVVVVSTKLLPRSL